MKIYHHYFDLEDGLRVEAKNLSIDFSPGHSLYVAAYEATGKIQCWNCGLHANCWIADKHKNDLVSRPSLNPYCLDKKLTMINRDHIIPRSLGGLNVLENLRVACEDCNSERRNHLGIQEIAFIKSHPHLVSLPAFTLSKEKMEHSLLKNNYNKALRKRIKKPFMDMEKIINQL